MDKPQTPCKYRDFRFVLIITYGHIFATTSLEHGMDVKTLSTIIGHVSSSTTLNIYAHVTDEMRRTAAAKIDQGIAGVKPQEQTQAAPRKPAPSAFQPRKGQRRKAGTGCVSQITETLWEGRYSPIWPNGKKHARNIYAGTVKNYAQICLQFLAERGQPAMEASWQAGSKCFMFMYFLLPHWVPAT